MATQAESAGAVRLMEYYSQALELRATDVRQVSQEPIGQVSVIPQRDAVSVFESRIVGRWASLVRGVTTPALGGASSEGVRGEADYCD